MGQAQERADRTLLSVFLPSPDLGSSLSLGGLVEIGRGDELRKAP
jgi:hypothetical protein